jgi:hypothetical protein
MGSGTAAIRRIDTEIINSSSNLSSFPACEKTNQTALGNLKSRLKACALMYEIEKPAFHVFFQQNFLLDDRVKMPSEHD